MRKLVVASLVLVVAGAALTADEFSGFITRFEDGRMVVKKSKGGETPEEINLKVADNVRIVRGKVNINTMKLEAGEALEGGKEALSIQVKETAARVRKYIEEGRKGFGLGVFAGIVTEGDKVIEIRVTGGGKRK